MGGADRKRRQAVLDTVTREGLSRELMRDQKEEESCRVGIREEYSRLMEL